MKNIILTSVLLAVSIMFTGCSSCCAQNAKHGKDHSKAPHPHAILIIDDVAYIDGCKDCDCVEEDLCICEAKADCECCRKHLKKAPAEMQKKCKEIKKEHAKKTADCKDCKKEKKGSDTACNSTTKEKEKEKK